MMPWTESGTGKSSVCARVQLIFSLHEDFAIDEHSDELHSVERVSLSCREQRRAGLFGQELVPEQGVEKIARLRFGERREGDDTRRQRLGPPVGASLEELCPSGAEHEERDVGEPADQMLDEIDRRIVRPVQVLEYEHRRSVRGEVLDEPPPRGERFCLAITEQRSASVETDEGAQVTFDPLGPVTR